MKAPSVEPARAALLADARQRAEQVRQQAERDARELLATAQCEAEELIAGARSDGAAEGRAQAALQAGHERTVTHWEVLAAQRAAYDELRRRVQSEVMALRNERGYAQLLERLDANARRELGEDAEIERDPPEAGGVRGRAGSRQVDYTLAALAGRCVDDLGPALAALWA